MKYYITLDDVPIAMYVADRWGRIVEGNPELFRLLGTDINGVRGRRVADFLLGEDSAPADSLTSGFGGTGFLRCVDEALTKVAVTTVPLSNDCTEASILGIVSPVAGNRVAAGRPMLTDREARLLELRAFGATNAEIARRLSLTSRGLDYNILRLAKKIGSPASSSAMIARAYHLGLLVANMWPPEVPPRLIERASRSDSSSMDRKCL
jgi:DNA-binding CsgD family transcriptional regulator